MGDRAQVHFVDTGVWLYTHWDAYELIETVQRALARKLRWTDTEYLARIVFCEMCKGDYDGEMGYGIGRGQHSDVYRVVEINCKEAEVAVVRGFPDSIIEEMKTAGIDHDFEKKHDVWRGPISDFIEAELTFHPDG